jgi:MoxR-like ATPase
MSLLDSIDEVRELLARQHYVAERPLATAIFLMARLGKPLLLEGEAGVRKTEVAKVIASALDAELIRLQGYEGIDVSSAVYEWNYARQIMAIRMAETGGALSRPPFVLSRS